MKSKIFLSSVFVLGVLFLPIEIVNGEKVNKEDRIHIIHSADKIYQEGKIDNIRLSEKSGGIILSDRVLIENDSPGAGTTMEKDVGINNVNITNNVWIKKIFNLDDVRSLGAYLVFPVRPKSNMPLVIEINGNVVNCSPIMGKGRWQYREAEEGRISGYLTHGFGFYYLSFPSSFLKKGVNEVILKTNSSSNIWTIPVANYKEFHKGSLQKIDRFPYTSQILKAQSGNKEWQMIEGEYSIRLNLSRFVSEGIIVSKIIDLGILPNPSSIINKGVKIKNVRLNFDIDLPEDTKATFQIRSGSAPFYTNIKWSNWKRYKNGKAIKPSRYLQWRAVLSTQNPLKTPVLKNANIVSSIEREKILWQDKIKVLGYHNEEILRSSFPYSYEKYDNSKLIELRKKFELDKIVAGSQTEFNKILRILHWAYRIPLASRPSGKDFSWNALDFAILDRTADGKIKMNSYKQRHRIIPGKPVFCTTYNMVLMQALLSFGITARHIGIAGHEVCEVWSNDYKKWVYLDAGFEYYCYDKDSNIPLNCLEIHNALYGFSPANVAFFQGDSPYSPQGTGDKLKKKVNYFRIIPRNNFLSQIYPRPLNQGYGWVPWPWNGYINWEDAKFPPLLHYSRFTDRPCDIYPTLNQTHYTLECQEEGNIEVYLDTFTPDFKSFLVKINEQDWKSSPSSFIWKLHEGVNTIKLCTENSVGNRGIISWIKINYSKH